MLSRKSRTFIYCRIHSFIRSPRSRQDFRHFLIFGVDRNFVKHGKLSSISQVDAQLNTSIAYLAINLSGT